MPKESVDAQNEPNGTELDVMDQSGLNEPNWTNWTKVDRNVTLM